MRRSQDTQTVKALDILKDSLDSTKTGLLWKYSASTAALLGKKTLSIMQGNLKIQYTIGLFT